MFVTILAIGLMLTLNFNTRIAADRELEQVHERIVQEIELLEREQESLTTELDFVSSDAYVEAWARDEGKMVREGEVLVIPKPPAIVQQSVPIPQEAIASTFIPIQTTLPKPAPWQLWWSLFFDSAPPS
jgi:cell division protein FtsB